MVSDGWCTLLLEIFLKESSLATADRVQVSSSARNLNASSRVSSEESWRLGMEKYFL